MVTVIVLALVAVAIVVLVGGVLLARRRNRSEPATPPADRTPRPTRVEPPPMTDLESALRQVTDRSGRPISDALDAESEHVDELRIPDDTGPLLRRALDNVGRTPPGQVADVGGDAEPDRSDGDSTDDAAR